MGIWNEVFIQLSIFFKQLKLYIRDEEDLNWGNSIEYFSEDKRVHNVSWMSNNYSEYSHCLSTHVAESRRKYNQQVRVVYFSRL